MFVSVCCAVMSSAAKQELFQEIKAREHSLGISVAVRWESKGG
jgi:hypothetical protein